MDYERAEIKEEFVCEELGIIEDTVKKEFAPEEVLIEDTRVSGCKLSFHSQKMHSANPNERKGFTWRRFSIKKHNSLIHSRQEEESSAIAQLPFKDHMEDRESPNSCSDNKDINYLTQLQACQTEVSQILSESDKTITEPLLVAVDRRDFASKDLCNKTDIADTDICNKKNIANKDVCDNKDLNAYVGLVQLPEYETGFDQQKSESDTKPHLCDVCNKGFTTKRSLFRHSLIHKGIKPHECKACGKTFITKGDMEVHTLIHDGVRPYLCNYCGKAFTQKSSRWRHSLIHKGIKSHLCNICDVAFSQKVDLERHSLIHSGVKAHVCSYCGRAFAVKSTLKKHALLHTGVKPHICNVCGKAFTQRVSLTKHLLTHTK